MEQVRSSVRFILGLALLTAATSCTSTSTGGSSPAPTSANQDRDRKPAPVFPERTGQPGATNVSTVVAPSPRVDKIELEMAPYAVNLDNRPGPDGVEVKVRLYNLDQPLAFGLQQGAIEFLLFEGRVKDEDIAEVEPFYSWHFSAADFQAARRNTLVGTQHAIVLNWSGQTPRGTTLTLAARIPRPSAGPLYARPVFLSTAPQ